MEWKQLFISKNLIGDGLYISAALREWHRLNPSVEIQLVTLFDHVSVIYRHMGVPLTLLTFTGDPTLQTADRPIIFDCKAAYSYAMRAKCHIAEAYAELTGVRLLDNGKDQGHLGPFFTPPITVIPYDLLERNRNTLMVSMFSSSCASRKGQRPTKMLPLDSWRPILRYLRSFGIPLRFLGAPDDRAPELEIAEDEYLTGVPLDQLAVIMRYTTALVTIDNGMGHLAASQHLPTFLLYPNCLPWHFIVPWGNPHLVPVQIDPAAINVNSLIGLMRDQLPGLMEASRVRTSSSSVQ